MASPGSPSGAPRRPARRPRANGSGDPSMDGNGAFRDPVIDKVVSMHTFEDAYSTEDFVTTLSEKLIATSKSEPGPFNPSPFINTFSPALDQLLELRKQAAERTKTMETEVRRANREYGKRLRELDSGFEAVGSSFSNIESKITDVGRTSARIGEQLENLHHTRSNAQATSVLLSYYLSLAHQTSTTQEADATTPMEQLFATRKSSEGRSQLAVILRRLTTVAKDVADNAAASLAEAEETASKDEGGAHSVAPRNLLHRRGEKERADRVRDEVEKYCERFEKDVLRAFDRSYRKGDPLLMAHCAKVLQDFNGGTSCVQVYVNQHDFFISKDRLLEEAGANGHGVDIWREIGDADAAPPQSEPGLAALLKEIRSTVAQEAQIVRAVFPNPSAVMQVFLQRVFAQVIQQHIESLVSRAASISTLAQLRILHLSHAMCAALVEDLKTYDSKLSSVGSKHSDVGTGPLAALLDQALEEMFVPWLEGSRYLDTESKNLVELYGGLLSRFARYHEMALKHKPNSLLDRLANQMSLPGSSGTQTPTGPGGSSTSAFSKFASQVTSGATSALSFGNRDKGPAVPSRSAARLSVQGSGSPQRGLSRGDSFRGANSETPTSPTEDRLNPADGEVSLEMAERMLRWHAEAVGRVVELSAPGDVPKNVLALSKVISEVIGRSFIETALDSAIAKLDNADTKAEPDLSVLAVLHPTDLVCHLWQRYASTALVPLCSSSASTRREVAEHNQHTVLIMEGKVNAVIQKAVDCIVSWLTFLLTKQKRTDYKPKNDELSFARTNTEPCELSCEFLLAVSENVCAGLNGKNQEHVLTEIGVAFHSLLLDHFKRYPVSPTGALMLQKDIAEYQEAIATFGISALKDRFEMLRQLSQCFIVPAEVLRSYMTEGHLGRIDASLLRPYLQQRSDWSQFSRQMALDDPAGTLDDSPAPSGTATPSGGLVHSLSRKGTNRLSAVTGVAGAHMQRLAQALRDFDSGLTESGGGQAGSAPPSAFARVHVGGSQARREDREKLEREAAQKRAYVPGIAYMGIH